MYGSSPLGLDLLAFLVQVSRRCPPRGVATISTHCTDGSVGNVGFEEGGCKEFDIALKQPQSANTFRTQ